MSEPWFNCLPKTLKTILAAVPDEVRSRMEEIRVRENRALEIGYDGTYAYVAADGAILRDPAGAYCPTREDSARLLDQLTEHSLYTFEEELRQGFITIRGGHRVGIVGRAVLDGGKTRQLKDISGFNIRIARQVIDAAKTILPELLDPAGRTIHQSLIVSPPQQGKTTIIRDLSRLISRGLWPNGMTWPARKVGIVDERSEIAACYQGVPTFDVGPRTDVLDRVPKAEGMMMMIRSMSPDVLVVDEIGRTEDAVAVEEAMHAGIRVLATAHGQSLEDIAKRPMFQRLLRNRVFDRYVLIGRSYRLGTVHRIYDGEGKQVESKFVKRTGEPS